MRAAVFKAVGQPFEVLDDVEIIDPRAGEVRVRVRYCGLCHSDYSMMSGTFPPPGPVILGHEAAGVVDAVGPGVDSLAPGDHVILTPLPACNTCYYCLRGDYSLCVNGMSLYTLALPDGETGLSRRGERILRGVGVGALAEYAITPAGGAIRIDPDIPLEIACVIGCAVQTGVGAVLNTAQVERGATVLVTGLGGVGMAVVQGARIAGASRIIVSDPLAPRRAAAAGFGATDILDPTTDDIAAAVRELTAGIGVDYAFETAGHATLIEQCIALTRAGGSTVCVGAPPFEQGVTIPNVVLFASGGKKLCGCLLGSCHGPRDIPRLLDYWRAGELDLGGLITGYRPLEEIDAAFADLAAGRGIRTVIRL